jgi:hypothetical protein
LNPGELTTTSKGIVKTIKTYATKIEADLAKIALDAADIPSLVVGVDVGMEGGAAGVRLLVPSDHFEAALAVLDKT